VGVEHREQTPRARDFFQDRFLLMLGRNC
jgi:hypothetical protein